MTAITELLRRHPEIALFAALSLGFFLGKRKVGGFSLGTSAGVLLAGVLIGQLRIPIPASAQDRLLRPVHLCGRVSGRPAILPGVKRGGPASGRPGPDPGRHRVADRVRGCRAARLRQGDGGRAARRLADSVGDPRQRRGRHRPARPRPRGEAAAERQRLGRLRRQLPVRDRRRRLVPVADRPAPAGRGPGRGLCRAGAGQRRGRRGGGGRNPRERPVPHPRLSGSGPALGGGRRSARSRPPTPGAC